MATFDYRNDPSLFRVFPWWEGFAHELFILLLFVMAVVLVIRL